MSHPLASRTVTKNNFCNSSPKNTDFSGELDSVSFCLLWEFNASNAQHQPQKLEWLTLFAAHGLCQNNGQHCTVLWRGSYTPKGVIPSGVDQIQTNAAGQIYLFVLNWSSLGGNWLLYWLVCTTSNPRHCCWSRIWATQQDNGSSHAGLRHTLCYARKNMKNCAGIWKNFSVWHASIEYHTEKRFFRDWQHSICAMQIWRSDWSQKGFGNLTVLPLFAIQG